jgi:hypothetical protein
LEFGRPQDRRVFDLAPLVNPTKPISAETLPREREAAAPPCKKRPRERATEVQQTKGRSLLAEQHRPW